LTQASANAQDGISAVQTAEGALTEVHDMLQRMNELAVKAANGTNSVSDRQAIQDEINQLVTEIDRVAETTKFNETYLLKGDRQADLEYTAVYAKSAGDPDKTTAKFGDGITKLYEADGTTEIADADALKAYLDADPNKKVIKTPASTTGGTEAQEGTGKDYEYTEAFVSTDGAATGKVATAYEKDSNTALTGKDLVAAVKAGKELYNDTKDNGQVNANKYGGGLTALDVVAGEATIAADTEIFDANGKKLDGDGIVAELEAGKKVYTVAPTTTPAEEAKEGTDYTYTGANQAVLYDVDGNKISENGLDSYLDIAKDGSKVTIKDHRELFTDEKGKNKLSEDDMDNYVKAEQAKTASLDVSLHVGADATKNNQITMKIEAMSAECLGVDGLKIDGKDDENALNAIETIKAAIQKVSTQRSALGAVQNRLEHTINNLDNVVENTTSAEAQIRDTDIAEEMVKYANNNILQQAGTSMLSQANQSNQLALSLLG
ncbi:MAG: hypothetical protein NC416_18565, partial [Eubacterium sp.]|nr:hypothetical protein [Eubacterium sp.]